MKKSSCNETYKGKEAHINETCVLSWFHEGPHNSGHHQWQTEDAVPHPSF